MTVTTFPYAPSGVGNLVGRRITDLPAAPSVSPTDLVPIVHDGQTMKAMASQFLVAALAALNNERTVTTTPDTVLVDDYRVLVELAVPGAVAIVLPNAQDVVDAGYTYLPKIIKDMTGDADVNNITITVDGGGTIDGQASTGIFGPYGSITLWPLLDGSGYFIQW